MTVSDLPSAMPVEDATASGPCTSPGLAPAREASTAGGTPTATVSNAEEKAARRVVNRAAFWQGLHAKAVTPKQRAETIWLQIKTDAVHVARDLHDDLDGSDIWPFLEKALDAVRAELAKRHAITTGHGADRGRS